jgi:hypothetical protein
MWRKRKKSKDFKSNSICLFISLPEFLRNVGYNSVQMFIFVTGHTYVQQFLTRFRLAKSSRPVWFPFLMSRFRFHETIWWIQISLEDSVCFLTLGLHTVQSHFIRKLWNNMRIPTNAASVSKLNTYMVNRNTHHQLSVSCEGRCCLELCKVFRQAASLETRPQCIPMGAGVA